MSCKQKENVPKSLQEELGCNKLDYQCSTYERKSGGGYLLHPQETEKPPLAARGHWCHWKLGWCQCLALQGCAAICAGLLLPLESLLLLAASLLETSLTQSRLPSQSWGCPGDWPRADVGVDLLLTRLPSLCLSDSPLCCVDIATHRPQAESSLRGSAVAEMAHQLPWAPDLYSAEEMLKIVKSRCGLLSERLWQKRNFWL